MWPCSNLEELSLLANFIALSSRGLQWLRRWAADKWSLGKPYTFNLFAYSRKKLAMWKTCFEKVELVLSCRFGVVVFSISNFARWKERWHTALSAQEFASLPSQPSMKVRQIGLTVFEPTFLSILGAVVFTRREKHFVALYLWSPCGRATVPQGSESGRRLRSASDRAWAIPRIGCSLWPPRRAVGRRLGKMIAWVAWIACVQWVGLTGLWIVVTSR